MNRASVSGGTTSGGLVDVYLESSNFYWQEEGRRTEKIFVEISAKFFPNLLKIINSQIQEAQCTLSTRNTKKSIPRNPTIKLLK